MFLYNLVVLKIFLLVIILSPVLVIFKKYRVELLHRLSTGKNIPDKATKKRILIHCSSVGEVSALSFMIKELDRTGYEVIISTFTLSGLNAAEKLSHHALIMPFDLGILVKKFLKKTAPDILIIAESEFWPNLITSAKKLNIPVIAVNCRISEKIFERYRSLGSFMCRVLNRIEKMFVQNDIYVERFLRLGVEKDRMIAAGNTKYDRFLKEDTQTIPVFNVVSPETGIVAVGSLREGEENFIADVISDL